MLGNFVSSAAFNSILGCIIDNAVVENVCDPLNGQKTLNVARAHYKHHLVFCHFLT